MFAFVAVAAVIEVVSCTAVAAAALVFFVSLSLVLWLANPPNSLAYILQNLVFDHCTKRRK